MAHKLRYLSAHYVFPVSSPPLKNGIVCIDSEGRIVDVTDTGGKLEERANLEFYSGILVPGFVNAHCHLELSHLRGAMEPHGGLPAFVSSVGKIRRADNRVLLAAAEAAVEEMTRNGIVAVGDVSNGAGTVPVKHRSRLWYRNFVEIFGLDSDRADELFRRAQQTEKEYRKAGLNVSVSPHAPYSLSEKLWDILTESYASSPPDVVSIHHQESSDEINGFFDGKGELATIFRENGLITGNDRIPPGDIMHRLDCYFRRAARCLLVHNTFSSKIDVLRYVVEPEKYYFVLCPGSNLFIQNRLPDLDLFGSTDSLNVCLGTDSLASNTCLSILGEMKIIQQYAPDIPFTRLLKWATLNGAKALAFDHELGSFTKKKQPGINLITHMDYDQMRLTGKSAVEVLVKPCREQPSTTLPDRLSR